MISQPPPVPDRILPCKFNLITKEKGNIPSYPEARKIRPLLVALRDEIYALSFVDCCFTKSLFEPCFESFNLKEEGEPSKWISLTRSPCHGKWYQLAGHALIDDTFMLVSLQLYFSWKVFFYSFNFKTNEWKAVVPPKQGSGYKSYDTLISGEAVVIGKNIYTYDQYHPGKLIVFSYTDVSAPGSENDLLLGSVRVVEGLKFDGKYPDDFDYFEDYGAPSLPTCALAKVEDGIFCVLQSLYKDCWGSLNVCVSIIQLEEDSSNDRCTMIKTFMCHLAPDDELCNLKIQSCFVL